ncbi:MAG: porin family protein [Rhodanobacter sp.]|nr:MAG: porin family protein [Rhodanobacter sp.]TAM10458.1 MAG: porin family protein [Rhodanobacter sp.]TAM36305.1 MAG: porin family protein [Rhodanobacter sp.]
MYRKLLPLVAACGLFATTAQADQTNGWFVNGNVGTAHYKATVSGVPGSGTDSNTAFILTAGYRDQGILGFEAGYTNLGSTTAKDDFGDRAKLKADGWTLGLNGHFNLKDRWYLSARGGLFLWKVKANVTYTDVTGGRTTLRGDEQALDWYAGIGTGYDISRNWSVGANFDYYKISKHGYDIGTRVFSVGAEYRF